ncbi:MAG: hypothetical protein IPP46_17840 [Bacteroidetes bacterium]|nr:hypothetical protein [Bacteroidota bacterium]
MQATNYSSTGEAGALQWLARLHPSGTWLVVPGGTNNPQDIFFGNPGSMSAISNFSFRM